MKLFICVLLFAQALESEAPDPLEAIEDSSEVKTPQREPTSTNVQGQQSKSNTASTQKDLIKQQPRKNSDANGQEEATGPSSAEKTLWQRLGEVQDSGALYYMRKGGIFMWLILAVGIVAAGVTIERTRSLRMLRTDNSQLRREVLSLLREDRPEEALQLCDREEGPVAAILGTGLRKFLVLSRLQYDAGRIEEAVVKEMDDYGVHITAVLERHLPILATVSSVAPMLGFLGTVGGMIMAFEEIVSRFGETNIVLLAAGGISVSLLTTAFGLIVGIPAFVAYNYFTGVINRFVLEVEASATQLIEAVTLQMALREGPTRRRANGSGIIGDPEARDRQTSDRQTSDRQTSDRQTSDPGASDPGKGAVAFRGSAAEGPLATEPRSR